MGVYTQSIKKGLEPDENLNFLEWADKYLYLPRESTKEYGKYRSGRTPMVKEVLLELSPSSPTEEVVVQKPTQLAGTTIGIIFLLASADMSPGPSLCVQPTGTLAESFSKKKITPTLNTTIKNSGRLKGKIKDRKIKDSGNTILEKIFPGGSWRFAGSNSGAVYRSESVRYMMLDDFDGIERSIGADGDPGELSDRRTGTFKNRKIYKNSTPLLKDMSNIEDAYKLSSQGRFEVPCPHCKELQYLEFGGKETEFGIKFERNDDSEVIKAQYQCIHCKKMIDEYQKEWMLPRGVYVHKYPKRKVRGFKYNALYTPVGWVNDWIKIVEIFLAAKNSDEKLQTFANTIMAETFEQRGSRPAWKTLSSRAEPYKITTVPSGGLLVTSGTDVHDNRLDIVVRAWGRGEENWLVYWTRIFGDVTKQEVWDQHDNILAMEFKHESGVGLRIASAAVDSGDNTHIVYNYCRRRRPVVMAIYGSQKKNQPILGRPAKKDVDYQGMTIKNGVQLWPVGTDSAKSIIYQRFNLIEPGLGYYHFPVGIDDEYYQQITAEKIVSTYDRKGFPVKTWQNVRGNRQNHALDAEVYCYAAAIRAGLASIQWDVIDQNYAAQGRGQAPPVDTRRKRRVISRGINA